MINGLKNLKDFQREITLLNIEKLSWARPPQKVQRKKGPTSSFDDLFNFLDVKVVDIFYLDTDCAGKCSKTMRVPCKVEFQRM